MSDGPETSEERKRFWSLEQSAQAIDGLIGLDPDLAHEVYALAAGSIGVVKAIKEKLADEVSYDPGETLTPARVRSIVGAPTDPELLGDWRSGFYEPYRIKYREQDR